jgi:AraC-like DNA-binding protein
VPHVSIIDASRLASVDPLAFRAADAYLRANAGALTKWVHQLAMVRPAGLSGAVMAGAYDVVTRPYPVEVFDSVADALAWLGCGVAPTDGAWMLEAIRAEATGVPHDLGRLRAVLDAALEGASLATAAKRLGVSARSLQRKLAEARTTFKQELADARVRVAKRLLLETDRALTEIALEVGCPSLQSFSVLFRRHAGEPPSVYRERLARGVDRLARQ